MRGGANFLSPSTKFGELYRHKQSSTSVKNAYIGEDWTGAGAVSVAFPHPQDTAEKAALMRELSFCHWERINGLFPPHLLVLFLTVCVLPRSPHNIPLLCQPLFPHLSAAYPAHFCMRCRGKCFPAVQAARHIYHDASLGSLRSAANITIKP